MMQIKTLLKIGVQYGEWQEKLYIAFKSSLGDLVTWNDNK